MSERIAWTKGAQNEKGSVGGIHLFTIYWAALCGGGYSLATTLPVGAPSLREVHPTSAHAKVAAERVLNAFIAKISGGA